MVGKTIRRTLNIYSKFPNEKRMKQFDDTAKLLLRLLLLLMLFHGVHKITHGVAPIQGMLNAHGLPGWFAYGVFIGEIIAPIFIALGFYARIVALVLAVNMLVALMLAGGVFPLVLTATGGPKIELALFYLIVSIVVFIAGPGHYAINRR